MNSYKLTGLLAGSASGDSVEFNQLNTAISTALTPYSTTTVNDAKYYWNSNLPSKI